MIAAPHDGDYKNKKKQDKMSIYTSRRVLL